MMPRRTIIVESARTIRMTICMTNLRFTQIIKAMNNVRVVIVARNM